MMICIYKLNSEIFKSSIFYGLTEEDWNITKCLVVEFIFCDFFKLMTYIWEQIRSNKRSSSTLLVNNSRTASITKVMPFQSPFNCLWWLQGKCNYMFMNSPPCHCTYLCSIIIPHSFMQVNLYIRIATVFR